MSDSAQTLDDISIRSPSAASSTPALVVSVVDTIQQCIVSQTGVAPKTMEIMNTLLIHQLDMLKKMDENLSSIMKNGKLDVGDIPDIILLFKHTLNLYSPQLKYLKISRGDMILFIREILILIVSNELLEIKNKDLYVKLIQSGTDLLSSTVDLDETVNCKKWFCCRH